MVHTPGMPSQAENIVEFKTNNNYLPFNNINNFELSNIHSSDSLSFLESLPNLEIVTEVSKISQLQSADIDINMAFQTDCRYYSVNEVQNINNHKSLNIFHTNINSLEAKHGNLHQFIYSTSSKFDILAITESSQKANENFKLNVKIDGYDLYKTGSITNKGGTVLYLSNNLNIFERVDLKVQHEDYESTWGEIKNKKSKNIVVGCI